MEKMSSHKKIPAVQSRQAKIDDPRVDDSFREIAEATGDAFYRLRYLTMRYDYLSPVIEKLTGYTAAEINEIGFREIVLRIESVENMEVTRKEFERTRSSGKVMEYGGDYLIKTKSGEQRWLTDRSYPWRDDAGTPLGWFGILRDITERKQVLEALRESEERFRKLVEKSPDAIGVHCDGKIVFINSAGARMFGASSPDELLGKAIMDFVHPDYRALVVQRVRGTQVEKKDLDVVEEKFVRLDGAVIDVEVSAIPISYMNRPATQVVVRDITNRKEAEDSLRKSQQNYKAFIENSSEGIWIVELDMPMLTAIPEEEQIDLLCTHSILVECNGAMARMYGYTNANEIKGLPFGEFLDRANTDTREFFRAFVHSGYHLEDTEFHEVDKDGNSKFFLNNILGMVESGILVKVWGSQRDITERKRLEQQLLQVQKMESLGTLAGGIAHDFNNILGIIVGYASHLESHKTEPEKLAQGIEAINHAVNRGASVVRQLLTFARRYDVMFEPVNVNEIITELVKLIEETFPKSIVFAQKLEEHVPSIVADHNQLHQTLLNLCLNARDAMPYGGTLTIETRTFPGNELREHFSDATEEAYVGISVSDTGIGMNRNTRRRIFEPFFTTKEHGKGTGLGLAVVYGVIKGHRGFIHVESEEKQGATFSIYLPVSLLEVAPAPSSQEEPVETPGGNETILLVEDEPLLLDLLKLVLEEKGYRVATAVDGLQALEVYHKNIDTIDLVLSDMGLPKLGGWETFQRMRDINPNVKVILASGFVHPELKAEMINQGAKDFVQKPYVPSKILRRIREVLDGD
jgi:PAS domain S-box-containing protein